MSAPVSTILSSTQLEMLAGLGEERTAQVGETLPGKPAYGRSLIVDPWGIVLAQAPDEETVITAELDRARLRDVREKLPSLKNRQADAYRWPAPA